MCAKSITEKTKIVNDLSKHIKYKEDIEDHDTFIKDISDVNHDRNLEFDDELFIIE